MNEDEIEKKATEDASYFFHSFGGYVDLPTDEDRERYKQHRIEYYKCREQRLLEEKKSTGYIASFITNISSLDIETL